MVIGDFALGVRVGPGVRLPRLSALYANKRRWKLPEQNAEDEEKGDGIWRSNFASLSPVEDKVIAVLEDQAARGQVLKLSETEAREKVPRSCGCVLGWRRSHRESTL